MRAPTTGKILPNFIAGFIKEVMREAILGQDIHLANVAIPCRRIFDGRKIAGAHILPRKTILQRIESDGKAVALCILVPTSCDRSRCSVN